MELSTSSQQMPFLFDLAPKEKRKNFWRIWAEKINDKELAQGKVKRRNGNKFIYYCYQRERKAHYPCLCWGCWRSRSLCHSQGINSGWRAKLSRSAKLHPAPHTHTHTQTPTSVLRIHLWIEQIYHSVRGRGGRRDGMPRDAAGMAATLAWLLPAAPVPLMLPWSVPPPHRSLSHYRPMRTITHLSSWTSDPRPSQAGTNHPSRA